MSWTEINLNKLNWNWTNKKKDCLRGWVSEKVSMQKFPFPTGLIINTNTLKYGLLFCHILCSSSNCNQVNFIFSSIVPNFISNWCLFLAKALHEVWKVQKEENCCLLKYISFRKGKQFFYFTFFSIDSNSTSASTGYVVWCPTWSKNQSSTRCRPFHFWAQPLPLNLFSKVNRNKVNLLHKLPNKYIWTCLTA